MFDEICIEIVVLECFVVYYEFVEIECCFYI